MKYFIITILLAVASLINRAEAAAPAYQLLWQNNNGQIAAWYMNRTSFSSSGYFYSGQPVGGRVVGLHDFDNNGAKDIVLQYADGSLIIGFMDATTGLQSIGTQALNSGGQINYAWRVNGLADFDKNGTPDLVCRNLDGRLAVWNMAGTSVVSMTSLYGGVPIDNSWKVVGFYDFNKNGQIDILWQSNAGYIAIWLMNGTTYAGSFSLNNGKTVDTNWRVVSLGDFNQDSQTDLVWQHSAGNLAAWFMNGTNYLGSGYLYNNLKVDLKWKVVAPK